jgi:hypothetical protein
VGWRVSSKTAGSVAAPIATHSSAVQVHLNRSPQVYFIPAHSGTIYSKEYEPFDVPRVSF